MKEIRFADWFCGLGGFRLGIERAAQTEGTQHCSAASEQCSSSPRPVLCGATHIGSSQDSERPADTRGGERSGSALPERRSGREQQALSVGLSGRQGADGSAGGSCATESRREQWRGAGLSARCVAACEIDGPARSVYAFNFGHEPEYADCRTVDVDALPDFDLLCFGWPCQDLSIAGKRLGLEHGQRSSLLTEAVRVLRGKKPRYFVAENVPGLFSSGDGGDFYTAIAMFADAGYDVQWQVLNTRWFLPQNRERIYFVGHLRGTPRPEIFPIGEGLQEFDGADRQGEGEQQRLAATAVDANYGKGADGKRTLVAMTAYTQGNRTDSRIQESNCYPCLDGSRAYAVGSVLQKTHGATVTVKANETGTLQRGGCNVTDKVPNVWEGSRLRRLTPTECERLQGFPDGWTAKRVILRQGKPVVMPTADTQRYKLLGNAVSVPVVEVVMRHLLAALARDEGLDRPAGGE